MCKNGSVAAGEYYAADSGLEHAMWRLKYDGLSLEVDEPFIYTYDTVNDLTELITITRKAPVTDALCGDNLQDPPSDRVTVSKAVSPTTATPGVLTTFNYTITFNNVGPSKIKFKEIGYGLPTGFSYVAGSSGGNVLPANNPTINGSILAWDFSPPLPEINEGEQLIRTFQATGILDQGTYCAYCDSAWVIFQPGSIGCVMAGGGDRYNIRTTAGSTYIQSAIGISSGSVTILSWDTR